MFFKEYDPLTPEEVYRKLDTHRRPDGGSERMAGLAFALRLEGAYAPAQLDYEFLDDRTLRCTENGVSYEAPYGAVRLGEVWFFSHLVPGTDRGWHCVLDRRTGAVTAFETWFGIEVPTGTDPMGMAPPVGETMAIPREVQRQYSFGWADFGDNARPERLHGTTNRLEGRGLHWRYSDGYEILSFFPSVLCSTVVELGEKAGGITVAHPTDYLRIDDETFILCRGEAEFSGRLWIEVVNFLDCRAVGLTLGIGEDDGFVYAFHSASLTITGDCAHLEAISDYGETLLPSRSTVDARGGRYTYRPKRFRKPADHAEALRLAREHSVILEENNLNRMASKNGLAATDFLVGKQFSVKPDCAPQTVSPWAGNCSLVYEYDVLSASRLRWRASGGEWQEEKYICFEPARGLFLFSHMLTGDPDFANLTHAVDFTNGLATTVRAQIGSWRSWWEVGSEVCFGTLQYGDLVPPFARRHHFTDDLVGRCYAWSYSKMLNSIHVYSAPESYSWTILREDGSGGPTWSSPCWFVKLRSDAYLFQWVEENCNGKQGLVVINPHILHDGGFFFGVGTEGLSLNTTGAYGRELGRCDILKYFGK